MAKKSIVKDNLYNFKKIQRKTIEYRSVEERLKDYKDICIEYTEEQMKQQASRCQSCGIPFCHGYGCPVENEIPDWNDLVYHGRWKEACEMLHSTNNFPEITGRVCPAPCEEACTLNVGMESVTIRDVELSIVEKGFKEGWVVPQKSAKPTGKKVAVIGSGPAGLAAAQQLARKGHSVTVFEKAPKAGGFLRYGIPDFKLEKWVLDRRLKQMEEEGVVFKTNTYAGEDVSAQYLLKEFDAVVVTTGSREPRDLPIPGRDLKGIHFATDYLTQSNMRVDGINFPKEELIDAKGKHAVVIGGGDTGSDCVGTSRRQGALDVIQLEILPKPADTRSEETPWPQYAKKLRTSSSHKEGCERRWCIATKKFTGKDGAVSSITAVEVDWKQDESGNWKMTEIAGSEFEIKADIVYLAMGFVHPYHDKLITGLGVEFDSRGNIKTANFGYGSTSVNKVFAAGDASRGQSLVVWAISYGRKVAEDVHAFLMK